MISCWTAAISRSPMRRSGWAPRDPSMSSASPSTSSCCSPRSGSSVAWGALVTIVLAIGACRPKNVDTLPPPAVDRTKVLGAGDELEITVAGQEDLSGKFQIGDDGKIRFPRIGVVECAGKPPQEVAADIEA